MAKQQLGELLEIWKTTRGSNEPIQGSLSGDERNQLVSHWGAGVCWVGRE